MDSLIDLIAGVLIVLTQQYALTFCLKYDRSRRQLDTVPNDIPEDAVEVILSSNSITRLEPNTFSRLSQCTRLDLNYNHISEIEPGAFNGLTALSYLSLGHNRLDQLSVNMFSGLVSNTHLNICRNRSILVLSRITGFDHVNHQFLVSYLKPVCWF